MKLKLKKDCSFFGPVAEMFLTYDQCSGEVVLNADIGDERKIIGFINEAGILRICDNNCVIRRVTDSDGNLLIIPNDN